MNLKSGIVMSLYVRFDTRLVGIAKLTDTLVNKSMAFPSFHIEYRFVSFRVFLIELYSAVVHLYDVVV